MEEMSIAKSAGGTISLAGSIDDLKRLLMKVREGSANAGLHLNIKTQIMTAEKYTALT